MQKRNADVTIWGKSVRNIYLAAESQANGILEFVAMLEAELTKT